MAFVKFLTELKKLNLPQKQYAIFGSGPLAIRKIRDANDLDIVVKPDLWQKLSLRYKSEDGEIIYIGNIAICKGWKPWFGDINNVNELIDTADIINGFPFVKLEYVLQWKKAMNREKDQRDIKLIEEFPKI